MNKRVRRKNKSFIQPLIIGPVCGLAAAAAAAALAAFLLVKKDIDAADVKYLWLFISFFSGFISGFCTVRYIKNRCILWGAASAGITAVIIMLIICTVNSFKVAAFAFAVIPLQILGGAAGGVISGNLGK